MPRFYIDDGAVPGARIPQNQYRTSAGAQSDCLNEAQAIARQRKLEKTTYPPWSFRYWRVVADTVIADAAGGNPDIWMVNELVMKNAAGTNLAYSATTIDCGHYPGYPSAGRINDGSTNNGFNQWWSPVSINGHVEGDWVGYDFGTPVEIATIELWNETANYWHYNVADLHVEGSQDGSIWTFIAAYTGFVTHNLTLPGLTPPSVMNIPLRGA